MADGGWNNPWKLTAIGMALVIVTALATGLVVANWSGKDSDRKVADTSSSRPASRVASSEAPRAPAVPTQTAISACNQYAATQAGERNKTVDTIKDGAIGAGRLILPLRTAKNGRHQNQQSSLAIPLLACQVAGKLAGTRTLFQPLQTMFVRRVMIKTGRQVGHATSQHVGFYGVSCASGRRRF